MPHYKDGSPAAVGDLVKGIGYNVKDKDGKLATIVGTVVGIVPNADACNVRIAHVLVEQGPFSSLTVENGLMYKHDSADAGLRCRVNIEYGETKAFEKIA